MTLFDPDHPTNKNQNIWDIAPCGLVSTLPDGTILTCNTTFSEWTGVPIEDLILKVKLAHFFTAGGQLFYEIRHIPLLNLNGSVTEIRYELTSGKETIPVLVNSHVKQINGQPTYLFSLTPASKREQHERKLLDEKNKAEQMVRDRNTYISILSHEIRTPLQVVNSISELLNTGNVSIEQQGYINVLQQTTGTLLKFVNDLLNLNKLESSSMVLLEEQFNIQELALDVQTLLKSTAEQKGLALLCNIDHIKRDVIGDAHKLKQVLINLVGNAIKFTNAGQVEISVAVLKDTNNSISFKVSVSDTGDGIEEKDLPLIFQPYRQTEVSRKNNLGGSGLGLDIARRIVELYGSTLDVATSRQGTNFSFDITLNYSKGNAKKQMEKQVADYSGCHALIADDHEVNLMVFSQVLKKRGIKTDVALNGEIAWQKLQLLKPDIIFIDLQMPVMDGMQLLGRIRSSEIQSLRNVPVIAVSGDQLFDFEKAKRQNELTNYLLKPYSSTQLDEILSSYLKEKVLTPLNWEKRSEEKHLPAFEKIKAITKGNMESYQAILSESVRVLKADQVQFEIGFKDRNLDMLKKLVHKNKTISDYFNAAQMLAVMESGIQILESPDSTIEEIAHINQAIHYEIGEVILMISRELSNMRIDML